MQALTDWPRAARRQIRGVFTDIDDTLTTHGAITADALAALYDLRGAGIPVIALTGRAVGWCADKVRAWPLHALGAEGGTVLLLPPEHANAAPRKRYLHDAATRARHQALLQAAQQQVLQKVPGVRVAAGAEGRETDIAFDHNDQDRLAPEQVAQVCQILQDAGLTVSVSSIHIHGCVTVHDKFVGAQWIVRTLFERDLAQELAQWAFVGDSANDEAMFRACAQSAIGVANVRDSAARLQHWPHYVTHGERGAGFAEVAQALLELHDQQAGTTV